MSNIDRFKSINKAISVLKCFNPENLRLSASEISKEVGMHRVTAYQMMETLLKAGFLEKKDKTGKYQIGPELYILGSFYLSTTDLTQAAEPVLKVLNELTGETLNVGILDKAHVILIMKEESKHAFRQNIHIGATSPTYASAMGKALLSELSEAELDVLFPEEKLRPLTGKTISTKSELKRELEQIRKDGISFDREGGYEGVISTGWQIRDSSNKVVAAISMPVPIFRMNETYQQRLIKLVKMGASLISYRLGHQGGYDSVHDVTEIISWWEKNK